MRFLFFQQSRQGLIRQSFAAYSSTAARPLSIVGTVALLAFASCAWADPPELFQADPAMINDFTASLPSHGQTGGYEYEIIQGLAIFEGDIVLGNVNSDGTIPGKIRTRGLGRTDTFGRWLDGIVPYLAPTTNSPTQQINIEAAIEHWMDRSRITFIERTEENADQYPHYLRFANSNSCASYVGMQGGEQSLMVSDGCTTGSIVHEIGHALGLFHEHTRSDRDNYVQINWARIIEGKDINFNLQNAGTTNYGPYDYGSIMHYGEYFFSANGRPTIVVPDGVEIGQRVALSEIDAASVDEMYATDLALLPPSDVETSEGLELGITVLNQGNLGAHEVQLVMKLADDTVWTSVSEDSGWECMDYSSELRCIRPTMTERTESRFVVMADPGSASAEDAKILLTTRTFDTNTTNNHYNDDGSLTVEPANQDATTISTRSPGEPATQVSETSVISVPDVETATQVSETSVIFVPDVEPATQVSETSVIFVPDVEPATQVSETSVISVPDVEPANQVSETSVISVPDVEPSTQVSETSVISVPDFEAATPVSETPVISVSDFEAAKNRAAASFDAAAAGAFDASLFLTIAGLLGWRRYRTTARQLRVSSKPRRPPGIT